MLFLFRWKRAQVTPEAASASGSDKRRRFVPYQPQWTPAWVPPAVDHVAIRRRIRKDDEFALLAL